ncbi:hypothetical protein CERSUDRAFT_126402 [Gelatoporia subvermispora B]|uniref:Mid2 domain-containing protein n=1 Tax=Ceriporiopsis subvermispora (strain B) TaxID=914234 RepID=M2QL62_CERS8|nr:hypothetical protein CERSUDRAFT_126402 [Gelatoporia subvermispora B]
MSVSLYNLSALVADDTDPNIVYSSGWQIYPPSQTLVNYFNNTLHFAASANQWATFSFSGTGIEVYGSLSVNFSTIPQSSYSVDGVIQGMYQPPPNFSPPFLASNILFFRSPMLKQGAHILNITVDAASSANQYFLDYIVWTPESIPSSFSSASFVFPTTSMTPTTAQPTLPSSVGSATGEIVPSASALERVHHASSTGAIIGGIVGGVAVILVLAIFYLIYRRKRSASSSGMNGSHVQLAGTDGDTEAAMSSTAPPVTTSTTFLESEKASMGQPRLAHIRTDSDSNYASGSTQSEMTLISPIVHEDSGLRIPPSVTELHPTSIVELPPAYTAD